MCLITQSVNLMVLNDFEIKFKFSADFTSLFRFPSFRDDRAFKSTEYLKIESSDEIL